MEEAIKTLSDLKGKRKIAILGDMLELGRKEMQFHKDIGAFCFDKGIDVLITVGDLAKYIALGAKKSGMQNNNINCCKTNNETVKLLNILLEKGDVLLFKGSRSMRLEEIVNRLKRVISNQKPATR